MSASVSWTTAHKQHVVRLDFPSNALFREAAMIKISIETHVPDIQLFGEGWSFLAWRFECVCSCFQALLGIRGLCLRRPWLKGLLLYSAVEHMATFCVNTAVTQSCTVLCLWWAVGEVFFVSFPQTHCVCFRWGPGPVFRELNGPCPVATALTADLGVERRGKRDGDWPGKINPRSPGENN